jgi:hypothetical protein
VKWEAKTEDATEEEETERYLVLPIVTAEF